MGDKRHQDEIPSAFAIQLARLFGSESAEARGRTRTANQWKRTLKLVLRELDRYLAANVESDELHLTVLATSLAAAEESLKTGDFWPGYAEGITRFALALLGDYPDHRNRRGGAKPAGYYGLARCRSVRYVQDTDQRLTTLLAAGAFNLPGLRTPPRQALSQFRREAGVHATYREFFQWYRRRYPGDYAAVF